MALAHRLSTFVNINKSTNRGMDELQKVKKFLRQWESEFFHEHKRRPSKVRSVVHTDSLDSNMFGIFFYILAFFVKHDSVSEPVEPVAYRFG